MDGSTYYLLKDIFRMDGLKSYLSKLNIFGASNDLNEESAESRYVQWTNLMATRVFFIVLFLSLIIFVIFASLNTEIISVTVWNATQTQIKSLPNNRICPCSRISIPYGKFIFSNPSFHQVCSSDFISDRWITSLFNGNEATYFFSSDLRSTGFAQFQALASFCKLSKERANRMFSFFESTRFISSKLVDNVMVLQKQVAASSSTVQSSSSKTFRAQIELISMLIATNQLLNGLNTNIVPNTNRGHWALYGSKIGARIRRYGTASAFCYCTGINPLRMDSCRGVSGIYSNQYDIDANFVDTIYSPTIAIPNFSTSCMPVDATLLSSLECFFNQSCVNDILPFLRVYDNMPMNFTALNNQLSSRYNSSSQILSIVEEFMVEDWLIRESYDEYFRQCLPTSCTYLKSVRPNFLELLETIIGLLGGLCSVLLILIPFIVRFICKKFWPMPRSNEILPSPPPPRISCK
jgi:hypothetical protein